jgi:LuxR family maltose regulon positive regulatory protein
MKKFAQSRSSSPARQIALKIAEAMYSNSLAERRKEAARSVTDGIDIADKTGVHVLDAMLFIQGICSALNENDLVKAKQFLSKMEGFSGNRRTNTGYFCYFSAWYHFLCGDVPRAVVAAQKSLELIEGAGVPVSEALIRLMLAQVLKEAGDDDQACRQLVFARKIAEETGSSYLAYLHSMAGAYFAFGLKNDRNGLEKLRRGLSLGRQKGFVTIIYFWHPDIMCTLCTKALAAGIEVAYVQTLIRKLNLVPQVPPLEIETWPWPVKIHTLGRFALFIGGVPIKKNVKVQKKPLLLLKALIALGACDVREEQITDILWPDADGDAGHNAFTTTLARLRRLLGDERAVSLSDGRLSLDNRLCWVDRWSFEQLCRQAEALLEKDLTTDPIALKQIAAKAAALYHGNFLNSDADQSWTVAARERLRTKYFRLIDTVGRCCRQTGDYEGAARYYLKGLESDPLAEVFYQGLLTTYICLGRSAEALAVYRQCSQVLNAGLGIAPSLETEALLKKIV